MLPVLHADTAGIDIGAEEIFVAVSAERTPESVRSFGSFTRDLHELAHWLQECRVRTVAMESTGVYFALSSALIGRVQVLPALG
jgi:transposase